MNFQERKLEADPLSRDDPRCVSFLARSRESRFSRSTTSLDTSVTEQTPTTLSASSANSFSSKGNYEGPFEEEGRWSAPTKKGERKGFLGKDRCDLTNGSGSDPATNFPPPPKNEKKEGEDQEETQTEEELDLTSSTDVFIVDVSKEERDEGAQERQAAGFLQYISPETILTYDKEREDAIYFPLPQKRKAATLFSFTSSSSSQAITKGSSIGLLRTIWNEPEERLRTNGVPELKAASLERLLDILFLSCQGTEKFRKTFLLTLPTFTTPIEFMTQLIHHYFSASDSSVRERIVEILVDWMDSYNDGFEEEELRTLFESFLSDIQKKSLDQRHSQYLSDEYHNSLVKKNRKLEQDLPEQKYFGWKSIDHQGVSLYTFAPQQMADSLTEYSFQLFKKMNERESLAWLEGKKGSREDYPHIDQLVDLFNRLSGWTSQQLVTSVRLRERTKAYERLVDLAGELCNLRNYQCLSAVLSGLTSSSVGRMKRTLTEIPSATATKLKDLEWIFSLEKNFKNYREIMDNCSLPCVPYLGMYQKDLFFLNDGNPNKINDLINFSKRTRISEVIFDIHCCQNGAYTNLVPFPSFVAMLYDTPIMTEKELHLWSRRVDPRDSEMVVAELVDSEKELQSQLEESETREKSFFTRIMELEQELADAKKRISELERHIRVQKLSPANGLNSVPPPVLKIAQRTTPVPVLKMKSTRPQKAKRKTICKVQHAKNNVLLWTVNDVSEWVKELVGGKWADLFVENRVLGADLLEMARSELAMFIDEDEIVETLHDGVYQLRKGVKPSKVQRRISTMKTLSVTKEYTFDLKTSFILQAKLREEREPCRAESHQALIVSSPKNKRDYFTQSSPAITREREPPASLHQKESEKGPLLIQSASPKARERTLSPTPPPGLSSEPFSSSITQKTKSFSPTSSLRLANPLPTKEAKANIRADESLEQQLLRSSFSTPHLKKDFTRGKSPFPISSTTRPLASPTRRKSPIHTNSETAPPPPLPTKGPSTFLPTSVSQASLFDEKGGGFVFSNQKERDS